MPETLAETTTDSSELLPIQTPAAPPRKKKKIKVTKVVNGHDMEVEEEVDDVDGPTWGPKNAHTLLNKPIERVDGPPKAMGTAIYSYDVRLPGMLHGRILRSPYACAQVQSIDTSKAEALPGVKAVISFGNKTLKYEGDPVAAVAAESPEIGEDAIRAIQVTYKPLPYAVTPEQATAPNAPSVYRGGPQPNVQRSSSRGDRGDVDVALPKCDVVVERKFTLSMQHHCCLETHGVTVDYRGGNGATVYASTQGTFTIPGDAAHELGLPEENVTSVVEYMGGGFGSKFGLDLPGQIACQLSKKAKLPVKLMLTRTDEFLMAGNRNGAIQTVKVGATKDGKLQALATTQFELGGLGSGGLAGLPYVYRVPSVYRESGIIHTNQDASRAMRGPGHPQASFAMESLMDDLADKLGMDALEFRKRNTDNPTYHRQLDMGAEAIGWKDRPIKAGTGPTYGPYNALKRGWGCGVATWGGGGHKECVVDVFIKADGSLAVQVGTQDLGTGSRTYTAAIVAEEFGLPVRAVQTRIGRSTYGQANASGGSTTTGSLAPAVKNAAYNAKIALFAKIAAAWNVKPETLTARDGMIATSDGSKTVTWKQACAMLGTAGLTARGEWSDNLQGSGIHGAQFAQVEVDIETGHVRVVKMVGVQDCGLALNRTAVISQLNGGMIQSLGYALLEQHVTDANTGLMLNPNLEEYKLPGCLEIPEMVSLIDDGDTREVPIGMAEPATIPGASAIANAVFNATGVRINSLPITPDLILNGLHKPA